MHWAWTAAKLHTVNWVTNPLIWDKWSDFESHCWDLVIKYSILWHCKGFTDDTFCQRYLSTIQPEDQAAASMSEAQLMTKHLNRFIRLLKLLNLFCSQLDINRSCEKCRKKHGRHAELDFLPTKQVIQVVQWCSANDGCCYTWDVMLDQGTHDTWEHIEHSPGLLKIQASDNWAMLTPFAFAISSTRLMISWVKLSVLYCFSAESLPARFVTSVKGLQRSPRAMGDQGIEPTLNHYGTIIRAGANGAHVETYIESWEHLTFFFTIDEVVVILHWYERCEFVVDGVVCVHEKWNPSGTTDWRNVLCIAETAI